ncbi:MAG TPA: ABC transporter ATP-binding protein [Candidatus Limnocylindrales bacterium]|nr:ABC transporter ATP-binding protein [Candidatus Limnocylindrales bacterium]
MLLTQETPVATQPRPSAVVASLEHAHKTYGAVAALRDVSFAIRRGESVALLGPNGAGKTTTIGALLGLRRLDSGTVRVFGAPPLSARARQLVGVITQDSGFPATLTVGELAGYACAQYERAVPVETLLARFALGDLRKRQTGGLSGGERRRLGVALAFAGRPELVFLDEPTTGLDVESRRAVWSAITDASADGTAVLLTTHNLQEAEALATRAVVISHGSILADDDVSAIRAGVRTRRVSLTSDVPPHGDFTVSSHGKRHSFVTADSDAAVRELVFGGVPFRDLEIAQVSLEEAFLQIVGQS